MTFFDKIGEPRLEQIVSTLVDRMRSDLMIGFHFRHVDRERLVRLEFEHAAELLGGPIVYSGRDLRKSHLAHRIAKGHFDRRKVLLEKILREFGIEEAAIEFWLKDTESHRDEIEADASRDPCGPVDSSGASGSDAAKALSTDGGTDGVKSK